MVGTGRVTRIGVIGFGFIGSDICRRAATDPRIEIVFVHNRSPERLRDIPPELILGDLKEVGRFAPDLIVETAGPEISVAHGERLLDLCDYMPLSLTALADDAVRARLEGAAAKSGHSLYVAHGALVGADSLVEWRDMWEEVSITFRKPPASIGLERVGRDPKDIVEETVIFDGSVREIAALFPHNVNAMVACALATVGLDRTRAKLIADPTAKQLALRIEARGCDGSRLDIERSQPAVGVSGSEMAASVYRSMLRATGAAGSIEFV